MTNLKITVNGKVQGVWFRVKTKEKADVLGLCGFVKNEDNGSVYLEVSGETNSVYLLVEWLQNGSEMANVKSVCIEKNSIFHSGKFIIKR